jgi:hypothetical protein
MLSYSLWYLIIDRVNEIPDKGRTDGDQINREDLPKNAFGYSQFEKVPVDQAFQSRIY